MRAYFSFFCFFLLTISLASCRQTPPPSPTTFLQLTNDSQYATQLSQGTEAAIRFLITNTAIYATPENAATGTAFRIAGTETELAIQLTVNPPPEAFETATASAIASTETWQMTQAAGKLALVYQTQTAEALPSSTPIPLLPVEAASTLFYADLTITASAATRAPSLNPSQQVDAYRTQWMQETRVPQMTQILVPITFTPILSSSPTSSATETGD